MKIVPFTIQSNLPQTFCIRGSRSPRKNSSSTTGARKTTRTDSANNPKPLVEAVDAIPSVGDEAGKFLGSGPWD